MRIFTVLVFMFMVGSLQAQEIIDIQTEEVQLASELKSPKTDLTAKAIERISFENIEGFIGSEKLKANEEKIKKRIIPQSRKYILSMRSGKVTKEADSFKLQLDMKLSLKNLRAILLEQGLLYEIKGTPQILPVVRVSDQVALQSFTWWDQDQGNVGFAKGAHDIFLKKFQAKLKSGHYKLKSPDQKKKLSPILAQDKISISQALQMSESMGAAILVKGDIQFAPAPEKGRYKIAVHLTAYQTSNGRVLADVIREYKSDTGTYRKVIVPLFTEASAKFVAALSTQLEDAWKKGTFGTHQLKLVVRSELSPKKLDSFKKALLIKVRGIKAIRERLLTSRKVVYDIDSSGTAQQLAQSLKNGKVSQFKVEVDDVDSEIIELEVKSL